MCCSTGVCGPVVDQALIQFAADLKWLEKQGVLVERFNLSQQPDVFVGNATVKGALAKDGNDCLPLIMLEGAIVCSGKYPTRATLAGYVDIEVDFEIEVIQEVEDNPFKLAPTNKKSDKPSCC